MTLRFRTVTDTVRYANGSVATGALVRFNLEGEAPFTTSEEVLPLEVSSTVNFQGLLSVSLWCNGDSTEPSVWRCELPDGTVFRFVLPYADGSPRRADTETGSSPAT